MMKGKEMIGVYKAEEMKEMHLLVKSGNWVLELIFAGHYMRFYSMLDGKDPEMAKAELTRWGGVISQHVKKYAPDTGS